MRLGENCGAVKATSTQGGFICELAPGHTGNHSGQGETWEEDETLHPAKPRCIAQYDQPGLSIGCMLEMGHTGRHENGGSVWPNAKDMYPAFNPDWHICETKLPTLKVTEVFYSLQGEGARVGEASVFIRLQGCTAKHACARSGVLCDTEFESGKEVTVQQLFMEHIAPAITRATGGQSIRDLGDDKGLWLVWTGGEPLDQLTTEIVQYVHELGYKQALETSGVAELTEDVAQYLDHVTVSPKVAEHVLAKHFGKIHRKSFRPDGGQPEVDELRYVRHAGQPGVPQPTLHATHYYLSPHSDGGEINQENLQHCIRLCLEHPQWKLSVQQHKLWQIL